MSDEGEFRKVRRDRIFEKDYFDKKYGGYRSLNSCEMNSGPLSQKNAPGFDLGTKILRDIIEKNGRCLFHSSIFIYVY